MKCYTAIKILWLWLLGFVIASQPPDWQHLDLTLFVNISSRTIAGKAKWTVTNPSDTIYINLVQSLTVDSVKHNFQHCQFGREDQNTIWIICPWTNTIDSFSIFYSGQPAQDPSGWGGFYFTSSYAYNIGVGFAVKPHSFGRAWFPCPDTVGEKFTVTIEIHSPQGWIALASGLPDTFPSQDTIWKYALNKPIPAYLVSVAIAPYHVFLDTFNTMEGPKPVFLASLPQDTQALKSSFKNLDRIHALWEYYFGKDVFPRIGFNLVPFTGGAMEHPTNIAYSRFLVDGTLQYEYIIAHEMSHHWFGDNITCGTERHMWINEGFATYAEHLWLEHNGNGWNWQAVMDRLMRTAHIDDNGWIRLDSIPHSATYGTHAYEKGALVIHALRLWINGNEDTSSALGSFGKRLRYLFETYPFASLTSKQLISIVTGKVPTDTTDVPDGFYDIYIARTGYPVVWIDSWTCTDSVCTAKIYRTRYGYDEPANIPMPVYLYALDESGTIIFKKKVFLFPGCNQVHFRISQSPSFLTLNYEQPVLDASVKLFSDSFVNWAEGHMEIHTSSQPFFISHHFSSPGTKYPLPTGIRLAPNHFWTLQDPFSTVDSLVFTFNARSTGSSAYLDWFIPSTEQALAVFWRPSASQPWQQLPTEVNTLGSASDGYATLKIKNPGSGHFVIGETGNTTDTLTPVLSSTCNVVNYSEKIDANDIIRQIGKSSFAITIPFQYATLYSQEGTVLGTYTSNPIDINDFQAGIYFLVIKLRDGQFVLHKLTIPF